eukprot:1424410-Rhodomonas_salina.1
MSRWRLAARCMQHTLRNQTHAAIKGRHAKRTLPCLARRRLSQQTCTSDLRLAAEQLDMRFNAIERPGSLSFRRDTHWDSRQCLV